MEIKMLALPILNFSSAQAADRFEQSATRSQWIRQGRFILAVAVPLAVAACTGGAGLDIGPVDHSCLVNPGGGPSRGARWAGGGQPRGKPQNKARWGGARPPKPREPPRPTH